MRSRKNQDSSLINIIQLYFIYFYIQVFLYQMQLFFSSFCFAIRCIFRSQSDIPCWCNHLLCHMKSTVNNKQENKVFVWVRNITREALNLAFTLYSFWSVVFTYKLTNVVFACKPKILVKRGNRISLTARKIEYKRSIPFSLIFIIKYKCFCSNRILCLCYQLKFTIY